MKRIVLDTHTLIWHLSKPAKLGGKAKRELQKVDQGKSIALIPAISLIELTLLREAGRRLVGPPEIEALLATHSQFELLELDLAQTKEFMFLGAIADPFDRMIIAAARAAEAPILSADENITQCGLVDVIWD